VTNQSDKETQLAKLLSLDGEAKRARAHYEQLNGRWLPTARKLKPWLTLLHRRASRVYDGGAEGEGSHEMGEAALTQEVSKLREQNALLREELNELSRELSTTRAQRDEAQNLGRTSLKLATRGFRTNMKLALSEQDGVAQGAAPAPTSTACVLL